MLEINNNKCNKIVTSNYHKLCSESVTKVSNQRQQM